MDHAGGELSWHIVTYTLDVRLLRRITVPRFQAAATSTRQTPRGRLPDFRRIGGRDEVYQLKLNQMKNSEYVKEYLTLFNLHRHFSQTWKDEISMSEALSVVTAGPGYYFIGLSNRGTGGQKLEGHAFAVDMFDLKFFDPNSGQA